MRTGDGTLRSGFTHGAGVCLELARFHCVGSGDVPGVHRLEHETLADAPDVSYAFPSAKGYGASPVGAPHGNCPVKYARFHENLLAISSEPKFESQNDFQSLRIIPAAVLSCFCLVLTGASDSA